uniref:NADP-dependent oxidoreductase domain-containing protein n=1 Tax=Glossina pallidipes TaxID=7398 RepID=A0A1A9ZC61_GLOPL
MYKINLLAKSIVKPVNIAIHLNTYLACRRGFSANDDISPVPCITMNNGCKMPALGLGTWGVQSDEWVNIVKRAIDCGYRHIDTALLYRNEKQIGQAIKEKIKEKVIKREDIFLVTKLWNTFHDPENVMCGCKKSLTNLGLDYVDMYLMHTPMGAPAQKDDKIHSPTKNGKPLFTDTDYVCTWRAMEELVKKGLCKNIGVCNFNIKQLERLLKYAKIIPQTLQIEHHPYLTQKELAGFCRALKIVITCYSPLGSPNRPWAGKEKILLKDPQASHATIPNPGKGEKNMADNICIFDFCLTPEDIGVLDGLNANLRYFKFTGVRDTSTNMPTLCLNNGSKMPALGLGTWGATEDYKWIEKLDTSKAPATGRTKPEEMVDATKCALEIDYRLIDTAFLYKNEKQIGQAIKAKIEDKTLKREDIFLVTKLWNNFHDPKCVKTACEKSLKNLCMDYIDLYLMHTPMGTQLTDDPYDFSPVSKDGKPFYTDEDYICTNGTSSISHAKGITRILNIAEKHKKTPAQVLIRYPIDLGYATIPQSGKSVEFMKENFDAINFKLCPEDIQCLDSLNENLRFFNFTGAACHPHHPFGL